MFVCFVVVCVCVCGFFFFFGGGGGEARPPVPDRLKMRPCELFIPQLMCLDQQLLHTDFVADKYAFSLTS